MKNEPKTIEKLWAYISVDQNKNEGVVAVKTEGGWLPCVAADEERISSLRPLILQIAKERKEKIKLICLSKREEIEDLN